MNPHPIGIFDSGLGGLSVWREVTGLLPHESTIYFADSANCPYGGKTPEEITRLSARITGYLLSQGCKLIVVACNTATAAAIDYLRAHYDLPFVGMEPAVKPAALDTRSGHIGVLATAGTFRGSLYRETSRRYASEVKLHFRTGDGLVELVEAGELDSPHARALLHRYLDPMREAGIDQLVLGCTHYPFLRPLIEEIVGPGVRVIDPAPAVARQVQRRLEAGGLLAPAGAVSQYRFLSGGDIQLMQKMVQNLRGATGEYVFDAMY